MQFLLTFFDLLRRFINNCVGAKNLRNYLLFLMWVIAAMAFCMLQAGIIFVLQVRGF